MSLTERLAGYFLAHPDQWIDGKVLAQIAGGYAWRTRVSDLRKPPHEFSISNRVRTEEFMGQTWKVSEYRYNSPAVARLIEAEQHGAA